MRDLVIVYVKPGEKVSRIRRAELEAALDVGMTQTDMNIASAKLDSQIRTTLSGEALEIFDLATVLWRE